MQKTEPKDERRYMSPDELLSEFPTLRVQGWTPAYIGVLQMLDIVHGFRKKKRVYINVHSFKRMLKWRNDKLDEKKVNS